MKNSCIYSCIIYISIFCIIACSVIGVCSSVDPNNNAYANSNGDPIYAVEPVSDSSVIPVDNVTPGPTPPGPTPPGPTPDPVPNGTHITSNMVETLLQKLMVTVLVFHY